MGTWRVVAGRAVFPATRGGWSLAGLFRELSGPGGLRGEDQGSRPRPRPSSQREVGMAEGGFRSQGQGATAEAPPSRRGDRTHEGGGGYRLAGHGGTGS